MSIQLIDNFELNVQKPIDNRFVVGGTSSFYQTRYDIVNAYHGLRIWDLNDNQPYVYDGSTWSSESNLSTIQGSGTTNYIPKFTTSNSLGESVIFENSGNIIIGTTSVGSPSAKLVVNGNIKANSGFYYYGSGLFLTSLNATEITTGTLDLARLQLTGSNNWVLSRNASSAVWVNPLTSFSVGTASALAVTRTLWGQNFNGTQNVTGNISVNGSVTNITGTVQFKNTALPTPGILSMSWVGTSNINSNLYIPGWTGNRTMALLEQQQTFTKTNTFTVFQNFQDNIQVGGTSSFHDELDVYVTKTLNLPPPFGPVTITTNPLNVTWGYVGIGSSTGNPLINITGGYTFKDDEDSGMFRFAPSSSSTQSSIRMLSDSRIQMILGNNISATHSTTVEQYTTPGIAMMSLLDTFLITNFDNATYGGGSIRYVWLQDTWSWSSPMDSVSMPYTTNDTGTSGPGVAAASAGINAANHDRIITVQTGGRCKAQLYLQFAPGSGSYYSSEIIWKDSSFTMVIPAGRKWKLRAEQAPSASITIAGTTYVVPGVSSNSDDIRVFIYKYGMS